MITEIQSHSLETVITLYLESLPGYENSLHKKLTVRKHRDCLKNSPQYSLLSFMENRGIITVEQLKIEDLEQYKDFLLNKLAPNTVKSYVTTIRGLLNYANRMGWIPGSIRETFHIPKINKQATPIITIPPEIEKGILAGDWGKNPLIVARNKLITCLILKRGLLPMEFEGILEEHIKPFNKLGSITVFGKNKKSRDVLLDTETLEALRVYMIERAHYLWVKKINTQKVFLSINSHSHAISKSGIQAVIRGIKAELRLRGYVFDLSGLNPQNFRKVAIDKSYKQSNKALIPHVDLTLAGQHGYDVGRVSTYNKKTRFWKKNLKNAHQIISHIEGQPNPDEKKRIASLQGIFPESSFFNNFGVPLPATVCKPVKISSPCQKLQGVSKPDREVLRGQLDKLGYSEVAKLYNTSKENIRKWSGNYVIRGISPGVCSYIFQAEGI
jgi:site-specific recombinase XerD